MASSNDIPTNANLNGEELNPRQTAATLAQALQEISKGESTAAAMENKLSLLEQKIDELLANVARNEANQEVNGASELGASGKKL